MTTKKGKGCEDLERAGKLQTMQYFGAPLAVEDQLWLEHWQALMDEIGSVEYKPTCMFLPDKRAGPKTEVPSLDEPRA